MDRKWVQVSEKKIFKNNKIQKANRFQVKPQLKNETITRIEIT